MTSFCCYIYSLSLDVLMLSLSSSPYYKYIKGIKKYTLKCFLNANSNARIWIFAHTVNPDKDLRSLRVCCTKLQIQKIKWIFSYAINVCVYVWGYFRYVYLQCKFYKYKVRINHQRILFFG